MPNPITLGTLKIGHEPITIELIEEPDQSPLVRVTWPRGVLAVSPRRFPEIAASLTRLFSSASIELARLKAGDRQ